MTDGAASSSLAAGWQLEERGRGRAQPSCWDLALSFLFLMFLPQLLHLKVLFNLRTNYPPARMQHAYAYQPTNRTNAYLPCHAMPCHAKRPYLRTNVRTNVRSYVQMYVVRAYVCSCSSYLRALQHNSSPGIVYSTLCTNTSSSAHHCIQSKHLVLPRRVILRSFQNRYAYIHII